MLATLPHHVSTLREVTIIVDRFEQFLRAWTVQRGECLTSG